MVYPKKNRILISEWFFLTITISMSMSSPLLSSSQRATTISSNFPFSEKQIVIMGSKMNYVDSGKGDPILLIHGNPSSIYTWRNIIPRLAALSRVIAVDLIGFGKSDKPDIEYRFLDHAKYLDSFIAKLNLKNITMLLHDWGAALGFYYSMRNPENVKGLAFFEALITPLPSLDQWPIAQRIAFEIYRSPDLGWEAIVNQNEFIEKRLQGGIIRKLSVEEMNHYREPFVDPASRKPLWRWPNELPVDGKPEDVYKIQLAYLAFLCASKIPKLLLYADPGVLTPKPIIDWSQEHLRQLSKLFCWGRVFIIYRKICQRK